MRFELHTKRADYFLEYDRKFNLVGGDSGTGKSYFCEMALYADRKFKFVTCHSDLLFYAVTLRMKNWEDFISDLDNTLIIIDGHESVIRSDHFLKTAMASNNYYVLMTPELLLELPCHLKRYMALKDGRFVPDPSMQALREFLSGP